MAFRRQRAKGRRGVSLVGRAILITLRKFQREFIRRATSPEIDTAALSLPRGNGKSTLAGYLAARILTPSDPLFRAGSESVVLAASLEQGRIVYRAARDMLADSDDYRFADSFTRVQITQARRRKRRYKSEAQIPRRSWDSTTVHTF